MISSLRIRNLATIEDLEIRFREGFSILTGETGAGKSIIIDGIRLLLGEKASPDLIRTGKAEASVEGVFRFPEEALRREEFPSLEEDEVLIQRQISQGGTGKAYLNGVLVPVRKLKEIGEDLVDIYGQNDHVFLLQTENHLDYLDSFLGLLPLREEVSTLAQSLRRLAREKSELEARKREREQRLDFLNFQVREIEAAALRPGEWEDLLAERNILKNAEKIASLVEIGLGRADLDENSVTSGLARLREIVRELGQYDPSIVAYDEALGQSLIGVKELAEALVAFREKQSLGPEKLEELEARLSAIEKLKRKYGETVEAILAHLAEIRLERDRLTQSEEKLADLEGELARVFALYHARAGELSSLRRQGTRRLETQMEKEIALLGMKKARFKVRIESQDLRSLGPGEARPIGIDEIEFLLSPNPGEELRPLRKIASGGELSRLMLALKSMGKEKESLKTLIFDEIDSGIGGTTAESIAEKLRRLAKRHQVLCITHLPQIASFAPHHFRIDKEVAKDRTFTSVKELGFAERVTEISRLLSGSCITATAVRNAREMLSRNLQENKGGEKNDEPSRKRQAKL